MDSIDLFPLLCELLAKSALILAAAALIQRAWTRASAAQRHLVWCAALCTVLLLPLTRVIAPRWEVPLVRATTPLPERTTVAHLPAIEGSARRAVATSASAPRRAWPDWRKTFAAVWATGALAVLAWRIFGSARLRWLRGASRRLEDARIAALAAAVFGEAGLRRRVELRLSPTRCVPLTWGTLRPVLLLPAEAASWSEPRLVAALRHEAGHIVRGDHFTRWLAHLACALYWPNPLVWFAARSLRTAQEQATDDLVLRAGTPPDEYAAQLFEVARNLAERRGLAHCAVAMASPSTLERRLLAIVDQQRDRRPLGWRALGGGLLGVALTLGVTTVAQLQAQERAATPTPEPVDGKRAQVQIASRFLEVAEAGVLAEAGLSAPGAETKEPRPVILAGPQFQTAMEKLHGHKGVDVLSAPSIVTHSGQRALIQIIREFRYATAWRKEGKSWKPTAFETRNTGVTLEVLPKVAPDGAINLALQPQIVEFLGFIDLDTREKFAAGTAVAASGVQHLTEPVLPDAPAGRRLQPVFSARKLSAEVTVRPGQTIVFGDVAETEGSPDFPRARPSRRLAVCVSANLHHADGSPVSADPGAAQSPTPRPPSPPHP